MTPVAGPAAASAGSSTQAAAAFAAVRNVAPTPGANTTSAKAATGSKPQEDGSDPTGEANTDTDADADQPTTLASALLAAVVAAPPPTPASSAPPPLASGGSGAPDPKPAGGVLPPGPGSGLPITQDVASAVDLAGQATASGANAKSNSPTAQQTSSLTPPATVDAPPASNTVADQAAKPTVVQAQTLSQTSIEVQPAPAPVAQAPTQDQAPAAQPPILPAVRAADAPTATPAPASAQARNGGEAKDHRQPLASMSAPATAGLGSRPTAPEPAAATDQVQPETGAAQPIQTTQGPDLQSAVGTAFNRAGAPAASPTAATDAEKTDAHRPDSATPDLPAGAGTTASHALTTIRGGSAGGDQAQGDGARAGGAPADTATTARRAAAQPDAAGAAAETQAAPPSPTTASAAHVAAAVQVRGSPETVANLAAQIVKKLGSRSTQFDVELDPAGLGKVSVRVAIGATGQISAAMSFDNPQAAADLKARAAELQRALSQAGFDASGGLSFDVAGDSGRGQQNLFQNGEQQGQAFRGRAFAAALETAGDAAQQALSSTLSYRSGALTGVDVRV